MHDMAHMTIAELLAKIESLAKGQRRIIVALAGPPGSGKSTLAAQLASQLGDAAAVVPMDGFHKDNAELAARDLLDRKGAPETFEAQAFVDLVRRLRADGDTAYPTFDREADKTVPNGGQVSGSTGIVLIEGNYLLLNTPPWDGLDGLFDLTVSLTVPRDVLRTRLIERWCAHGLSLADATARAVSNDLRNVDFVCENARPADVVLESD